MTVTTARPVPGQLAHPDRRLDRRHAPAVCGGERATRATPPAGHHDDGGTDGTPRTADEAVAVLYATHWAPMVRLATLLTRDASVAEEVVQDAFVALHRRWAGLRDAGAAHGYLRTSVVNNARSALRHREVAERHRQPGPPEPDGPEERAVRSSEDARVIAGLRTLSRRQQEVLVLRYYADMSEHEIAETLGMSRGAVKSHAHRGVAALRTHLAATGAPHGGQEEAR